MNIANLFSNAINKKIEFTLDISGHAHGVMYVNVVVDDEDDFDTYVAAKPLMKSGAINVFDTAIKPLSETSAEEEESSSSFMRRRANLVMTSKLLLKATKTQKD